MPTKKKEAGRETSRRKPTIETTEAPKTAQQAKAYDAAVAEYASALELLRNGESERARELFLAVEAGIRSEPELAERARTYAKICSDKLSAAAAEPQNAEQRYYRAVLLSNDGQWDEAIRLLDQMLKEDPTSVSGLYARASAWALKGSTDKAVADLRQAIVIDPKIRFQAVNDPDFKKIREEPAFIDIVEPTPTGA